MKVFIFIALMFLVKGSQGSEACQPKDSDVCLQTSPKWSKNYKCATSKGYCTTWGKDLRRCCPESCGTGAFLEMHCNAFSGSGTCVYPNQAQCLQDPTCKDGIKNQNEEETDCGGPCPACGACKPKDSDVCLWETPSWRISDTCAKSKKLYCKNKFWEKDMRRCCPESCGTGTFTEEDCIAFKASSGRCTYPNLAQCEGRSKLASCFKFGQNVGGTRKPIQHSKVLTLEREDCIDLVKQKEPDANGAMFDKHVCWANFGSVGTDSQKLYKTCSFPDVQNPDMAKSVIESGYDKNCFKHGNPRGGKQFSMGRVNTFEECWKIVLTDAEKKHGRKTNKALNGATISGDRCYAVFDMTGVNNHKVYDIGWQTCHFDGCEDLDTSGHCPHWKEQGFCNDTHVEYMKKYCGKTCKMCVYG